MAKEYNNNAYLVPNKYHKKGDNRPCLKTISPAIIEGQEFHIAVWAPKPGKKGYSARFTSVEKEPENQVNDSVNESNPVVETSAQEANNNKTYNPITFEDE